MFSAQVSENNAVPTVDMTQGQRAFVINTANGEEGIMRAQWTRFKRPKGEKSNKKLTNILVFIN